MALILKSKGGSTFAPHPEGQAQGVCVDVIDYGMVETEWKGKKRMQPKCKIAFETNCEVPREGGEGPWMVWSPRFTASLSERAAIRPFLESWRGKAFTEEELEGFATEQLIGANAILQVVHAKKNGQVYANINAIMRPLRGMPRLEAAKKGDGSLLYVRKQDRPTDREDQPEDPVHDDDDPPPHDDDDLPF